MRRASFSLNCQDAENAKEEIADRMYRMNRIDWTTKDAKDEKKRWALSFSHFRVLWK